MSRKKSRSTGHGLTRQQTQSRSQTKRKSLDMLQLQQNLFERSPMELHDVLSDLTEDELPDEYEVEDALELDELAEQGSDIDIYDEDMDSTDDISASLISDYSGNVNESIGYRDHPTLMLGTKYIIVVMPDENGKMICRFESPFDPYGRLPAKASQVIIPKLVGFIEAIARWFQDYKQYFLIDPSPDNFVNGETEFFQEPIVIQKWFLARINEKVSKSLQISLPNFSRMLDKVWIVWPLFNMPLKSIFSTSFKRAWLVSACSAIYEKAPEVWRKQLNNPKFTKEDMKAIRNRSFDTLNPDEKLHLLRAIVKIPASSAEGIWHDSVMSLKRDKNGQKAN